MVRHSMKKDEVIEVLIEAGCIVKAQSRLADDQGWRLDLQSGQNVNVYDTGTVVVQGRRPRPIQIILGIRRPRTGSY